MLKYINSTHSHSNNTVLTCLYITLNLYPILLSVSFVFISSLLKFAVHGCVVQYPKNLVLEQIDFH